jgi:hypothetical protein
MIELVGMTLKKSMHIGIKVLKMANCLYYNELDIH